MTVFKGLGDCSLNTIDLAGGPSSQQLYPYPVYDFSFNQDGSSEDAEAYRGGVLVPEETLENRVTSILSLTTRIVNWRTYGLALGQIQRTLTSYVIPIHRRARVPASLTIADAGITADNLSSVLASIETYGGWGQAGPLTPVTGPPADGEIQVQVGSLTFNAAQETAPVGYLFNQTAATVNAYGGPGTLARIGELQFFGEVYDNSANGRDGGIIWFQRLQRRGRPNVQFAGGVLSLSSELTAIPTAGYEEPFTFLDAHSLTIA
ncbi:hypothetical protein [Vacuolonema iberomarrocanum]|uniref:hypothetical protein n=1 Tax=Vacuolonema iberomarrocanum TaxID=3454632 RepID=UPI0019E6D06D|nr:hypothetical protein [filamentous cyanobacterium LEGE 07170]